MLISQSIPARLEFACGHAALVSLPRLKGESATARNERIRGEKLAAQARACDFCGPVTVAEATNGAHSNGVSTNHVSTPEEVLMDNASDSTSTVSRRSGSARGVFPPPRKLSDEQERELARLYSETRTPTSEIARTFGISETSVARVAQRHGATLRRRGRVPGSGAASTSGSSNGATSAPAASSGTTRASSASPATRATPSTRGRRARTTRAASASTSSAPRQRFRISFRGERVVEATDMRAAIAQVEAEGATEISSISVE
jgi:transposase-like protein